MHAATDRRPYVSPTRYSRVRAALSVKLPGVRGGYMVEHVLLIHAAVEVTPGMPPMCRVNLEVPVKVINT